MNWEAFWNSEFSEQTEQSGQIAIYGAQMVAVSVYYAIRKLYKNCRVLSFIVSSAFGNPKEIDKIPVRTLKEFTETEVKVLIAVPENYHEAILAELAQRNVKNYICIDSKGEAALMRRFYRKTGLFQVLHEPGRELAALSNISRWQKGKKGLASVSVYMSKFYKDKPLKRQQQLPSWVHPIQAGAALTDLRISALCDNQGDNISLKNVNYSELTAAYWIGKHGQDEYLGLFHYRRILDIGEEDFYRLKSDNIEVILPYPTIHYPNIGEHHKRYLEDEDWNAMLQALEECAPAYRAAFPDIFSERYFYNYNMLIAKQHIWKDYCEWLFPILERTEELSSPRGWERADRYIGYIGENLTTLYFLYHRKDFNIAHTGRLLLI